MNYKLFSSLWLCLLVGCAAGPIKKQATQTEPEFRLEYEKFTLKNGLEVVLQVDKSDPIVALTTVVHAGSNREKPGRTGFAHFFEHMAFNDSENVPRGWNRKAIPDWGGNRNGGTWTDGTIYYEVVPKDAFDKILWIDSDRLGYMINTVTNEALEREKQVVKNEKRQRVDNVAYGYTREVVRKHLYPEGHPYSWNVIGSLPDLQAASLEDLKEFYTEFYGASNATLAIVGDIDLAETKRKVEQWFGEIRRGPAIQALPPMPAQLVKTKALYFEDNFAKLPELRLTFPTVESFHADQSALEVLGEILAGSKNSVIYQQVVEQEKLAPNVSSFNNSQEIAGEFVLRVRGNAGIHLDTVKAAIETALVEFERNGVDPKDLRRIKAEQETRLYSQLSTVLGKSNSMAQSNEFAGDPAYAVKAIEAIKAVTADDVMAVYRRYIKDQPAVITSFVPKGQAQLAVADSALASVWIEQVKANVASEEVSQGALASYEKTPTNHDRSEPPFSELPLLKMPPIWETTLGKNIRTLGIENAETPLVSFDLTIGGGAWLDPSNKKGTARLLASLMNEGTASKTAAELEQAIGLIGSSIRVSAGSEGLSIQAVSLAKNFEVTVAIIAEILSQPRWESTDFERVKTAALTAIKGREANANSVAALSFNKLLYGDQHPLGIPSSGTTETVTSIELNDLRDYYRSMITSSPRIHVVGNVSQRRAKTALAILTRIFGDAELALPAQPTPQPSSARVFFIDVPGSKQSVINIGQLTLASTDSEANKLDFTNEKLGGGISGDLAQTLRIEKGYTYGAYSRINTGLAVQPFRIGTSVRANATKASLDIMRDMLIHYGKDFSAADVQTTQQKLVKENTRAFESLNAKLGVLRNISKYEKSKDYVEQAQQELLSMQAEDFQSIAARYLDESKMIYVIVGDKATQLAPVQEFASTFNGDVIELDIFGNRL